MGLFEKLKNTFFEEEYVEVQEPVKPEQVAKKVEIKKEKKVKPIEEIEEVDEVTPTEVKNESYFENDLVNKNNKLAFFDDDDFEPAKPVHKVVEPKEEKRIYGESASALHDSLKLDDLDVYKSGSHKAYGATEVKFQPTPIISPIYGVLDKNYRKEEVIDKKDKPSSYVSRKNADLDSVRRKAYGENSRFFMDEKMDEKPKHEAEDDKPYLYDMMEESKPVVGTVTMGDAEEYFNDLGLEYNVDYKDSKYEKANGRRSTIYHDNDIEEVILNNKFDDYKDKDKDKDDDMTVDDLINKNKKNAVDESANLEDNLFDLVDSMYEGGDE